MINLTLPLPTCTIKGKSKLLTLNLYRNIHYQVSNKAKSNYKDIAWLELRPHRRKNFKKIKIIYTFYFENNHRRDIGNIGAVTDKFFSDSLVDAGIIKDDSHQYISEVSFRFGGIGSQRVEIEIKEVK